MCDILNDSESVGSPSTRSQQSVDRVGRVSTAEHQMGGSGSIGTGRESNGSGIRRNASNEIGKFSSFFKKNRKILNYPSVQNNFFMKSI